MKTAQSLQESPGGNTAPLFEELLALECCGPRTELPGITSPATGHKNNSKLASQEALVCPHKTTPLTHLNAC